MRKLLLLLASFATVGMLGAQPLITKLWETPATFRTPESVLVDRERGVLYVSNVGGTQPWTKDGDGSIGRVGLDGRILGVDWVVGLHAPKGLGLHQGRLYVADIDRVAVIDVDRAAIAQWIPIEGAEGLNDICVDSRGVVFVSDSKTKKVHSITDGRVATVHHDTRLQAPNGVLAHGNDFFVLDQGGGAVYKAASGGALVQLASGLEGGPDGIEHLEGSTFLVSCWAGTVYSLNAATGATVKILDTRGEGFNAADLGLDPRHQIFYVPTFFKHSVAAYHVR